VAHTLVVHVSNSDPVVGEVDELPSTTSTLILLRNPRKMDGKDLHYLSEKSTQVYWPLDKINFIELLGAEAEEEIIGFVRE
jgi:hypothetical protein